MLTTATTMPEEIAVDEIAADALQVAFALIAARLELEGYPVTGDFGPGELHTISEQFADYVRAMALNNAQIAALQLEL